MNSQRVLVSMVTLCLLALFFSGCGSVLEEDEGGAWEIAEESSPDEQAPEDDAPPVDEDDAPPVDEEESCPDESEVEYVSTDPSECARILFQCPEGADRFDNACGCGCDAPPVVEPLPIFCPAESDDFFYVAEDYETCMVILYSCPEGFEHYDDPDCGCGCDARSLGQ